MVFIVTAARWLITFPKNGIRVMMDLIKSKIDERIGIEKKSTDLMEESVKPL